MDEPLYIVDFEKDYLTSEMRRGRVSRPRWFPCPCDPGEECTELVTGHEDGDRHLGIWTLLQSWAMRHWRRRGFFVDRNGAPIPLERLAGQLVRSTSGVDPEVLRMAISRCRDLGWIGPPNGRSSEPPEDIRSGSGVVPEALRTTSPSHNQEGPDRERAPSAPDPESLARVDDGDDDRTGPPDTATDDDLIEALASAGVSRGRATKWARDPLSTPRMVRRMLHEIEGRLLHNPGGYLGTLMEQHLANARAEANRAMLDAQEQMAADLESTDDQVDRMTDDEIADVIEGRSAFRGVDVETVRSDPAFRRELVRLIVRRKRAG